MTTPPRLLASLVWGTRLTPTACVFGWREGNKYVVISEQALPFWPEAVAQPLRDRTCNHEPIARVWVDQEEMAVELVGRGLPAIAVQQQDAENGMELLATLVEDRRLIVTPRCPQVTAEYRSHRASDRQCGTFLRALTNLLACETVLTEVGDEPIPPEKQATIMYLPGVGYVDNPTATHARAMMGLQDDPFYLTWTDTPDASDELALEEAELFCRCLGAPVPDFLRAKRAHMR